MKDLNKIQISLIFIFLFLFIYEINIYSIPAKQYNKLIKQYIENKDYSEAERYLMFLKNGKEILDESEFLLEMQIRKNKYDKEQYISFLRKSFKDYKYVSILKEIIDETYGEHINLDDIESVFVQNIFNYPENFELSTLQNASFFSSKEMDIIDSRQLREDLRKYISIKELEKEDKYVYDLVCLLIFELRTYYEAKYYLDKYDVKYESELRWFIDFSENIFNSQYNFKKSFFDFFSDLSKYIFNKNITLEEFSNIKYSDKKVLSLHFFINALLYEKQENIEKSLFYALKIDESIFNNKLFSNRVLSLVDRLSKTKDDEYLIRKIKELEERAQYKKAYILSEKLNGEKKVYYTSRLLYYYFSNYEKAQRLIENSKYSSDRLDFLLGQIYLKSFEYDKAELLFNKLSDKKDSIFYESSLYNLSDIYIQKEDYEEYRKFILDVMKNSSVPEISGKLAIKYCKDMIGKEKINDAKEFLILTVYQFSDISDIYSEANRLKEEIQKGNELSEIQRELNSLMLKAPKERSDFKFVLKKDESNNTYRRRGRLRRESSEKVPIKRPEEIKYNIDTSEISTSEIVLKQEYDTQEYYNKIRQHKDAYILPSRKDQYVDTQEVLSKISQIAPVFFEMCSRDEKNKIQLDFAERLLEIAENNDMPDLKSICIVNIADVAYREVGDINKIVKYFYDKIKKYLKKHDFKNEDEKKEYLSVFYYEGALFFFEKDEYSAALDLINNYYEDIDSSYNNISLLKLKFERSLRLNEINNKDIKRLIEKDAEYVDKILLDQELYDNSDIISLKSEYSKLKECKRLSDEQNKLKTIRDKYFFFKENELNKKMSSDYYSIITEFEHSREVYLNCWNALKENKKYEDMIELYQIALNKLEDISIFKEEVKEILDYSINTEDLERTLNHFKLFSPISEKVLKNIDFSKFSDDFIQSLLINDQQGKYLHEILLKRYMISGNSDGVLNILKEKNDLIKQCLDYYISVKDYELLNFYYSKYSKISEKYTDIGIIVQKYNTLQKFKNTLNMSDLDNYNILKKIIEICIDLQLYDEAENYALVYKRVSGKDMKSKIDNIKLEKIQKDLIEKWKNTDDVNIETRLYAIKKESGADTEELKVFSEQAVNNYTTIQKIYNETYEVNIEKIPEQNIDEKKYTGEISIQVFEELLKKKSSPDIEKVGIKLIEQGEKNISFKLGSYFERKNKLEKALKYYRKTVLDEIKDENAVQAQYKIGLINIKMNKIDEALVNFQRLLRYFPEEKVYSPKSEFKITQILEGDIRELRESKDELDLFDKEGEYDEVNRFADISDNIDEIKEEIQKTTDVSRLAVLYYKLGEIYFEKFEKWDNALENYLKARENGESDVRIIERIATCYIKKSNFEQAIDYYEKYLDEVVDIEKKAEIHLKVIRIYVENLKEYNEALEKINTYADDYPYTDGYYEAMYYKAEIYEEYYRDYNEAIDYYTELKDEFQSVYAVKSQYKIAYIYHYYLKDYKQAKIEYERVINEYSDFELQTKSEEAIRNMIEDGKI